jgi:dihydropteroate synthase
MSQSDDLLARFPARASSWKLRTRSLQFGRRPMLMGIVNVTPDSFSDGGQFMSAERAVEQAIRLLDEGADLLDLGGESTRPYAAPVDEAEELARVIPVIAELCRRRPEAVASVDTSKAAVAQAALAAGAQIVNDVTGLAGDARMIEVVRQAGAGVCAMHMQGTPQTMQVAPTYRDVVAEIHEYLRQRRDVLVAAGIDRERICLDPGIGFGKTHQHNLTLMANCWRFHDLGCPLLVGHSRKGFIGKVLATQARSASEGAPRKGSRGSGIGSRETEDRLFGTIGGALALARQGVQVIRVHDVLAVRQALLLFEACGGIDGTEAALA